MLADSNSGENKSKQYRFRAPKSYTNILTSSSVELCGLSNNHMDDFGRAGVNSTKEALTAAGLPYTIYRTSYVFEKDGIKIGFISMTSTNYSTSSDWMKNEVPRLKQEDGCNAVVVSIHAGTEYRKKHDTSQTKMANGAFKAGADLVIMHHPHVL